MTSWGQLCQVGSEFYRLYPHQPFIPGVFISVTILAFYLFGNCLRDALDPHLRDSKEVPYDEPSFGRAGPARLLFDTHAG